MESHCNLSDSEFEKQFASLSLEPTLFSHEAHLRLARIHINKYGIEKAIENICRQIQAFATFHGDNDKFNLTVTIAAIRAVYHFLLKSQTKDFRSFINENLQLKNEFKRLIESHYSFDIFKSQLAKSEFMKPDLNAFDDLLLK